MRLGRSLFATEWPAQILKVRIDAEDAHKVAGIVISGVKFHQKLDRGSFTSEIVSIVERSFALSDVEEVDVWATVPIPVGAHEIVAGDFAQPTSRIVYSATVRRSELSDFASRLRRGNDVFWDPRWKASLLGR